MLVLVWIVLYLHVVHSQNIDYRVDPNDPVFPPDPNDPNSPGYPPKTEYLPDKEFRPKNKRQNLQDSGETITVTSDEDKDLYNRIIAPDHPIRRSRSEYDLNNPDEPNRSDDVDLNEYYRNDENTATRKVLPNRRNYKIVVKEKLRFHKPNKGNRITRTKIRKTRPVVYKTYRTKQYTRDRKPEQNKTYKIYTTDDLLVDSGSGSAEDTIKREKYLQDSDSDESNHSYENGDHNLYNKKSKFNYQPHYNQLNLWEKNDKVLLNHKYFDKPKYPKTLHQDVGDSWMDGYSETLKKYKTKSDFGDYDITDKTKYIPYKFGYKKRVIIPTLVNLKQRLSYPSYSSRLQNEDDTRINIYGHSPKSITQEESIKLTPYEDNVYEEKELFKPLSYQDRLRVNDGDISDDTSANLETVPRYDGSRYQYQEINKSKIRDDKSRRYLEQNYIPQLLRETGQEYKMYKKGSTTISPHEDALRDNTNDKTMEKLETVPGYEVTHNEYQNMQKFKDGDSTSTGSQEQESHEIENFWEVTPDYKYQLPKKKLNAAHDFSYPTLSTKDEKSYDYLSAQRQPSTNKPPNKYEDFFYLNDNTKSPLRDGEDYSVSTSLDSDLIHHIDVSNTSQKESISKKPDDLSSEFLKAYVLVSKNNLLGASTLKSTDDYSKVEYGDSTSETPTNDEDLYTENSNSPLRDSSVRFENNTNEYNVITEETPKYEGDINTKNSNVPMRELTSNEKNNLSNEFIYKGVIENTLIDENLLVVPLESHDSNHHNEKFTYNNTDGLLRNVDVKKKTVINTEDSNNTMKETISSKPDDLSTELAPTGVTKQTPFSPKDLNNYYWNILMNELPPDDATVPWKFPTFQNNEVTDNPQIGINSDSDEEETSFEENVHIPNITDAFVADGENVEDVKKYLREQYTTEKPVVHFLQQDDITNKTNSTIRQPSDNDTYLNQTDMENNFIPDRDDSKVIGELVSSRVVPSSTIPNNSLEEENVSYVKSMDTNPPDLPQSDTAWPGLRKHVWDDDKYWTSYYIDNTYSGSDEDKFKTVEEQKDNALHLHGRKNVDEKSPKRMPIHHSTSTQSSNASENIDELVELCTLAKSNLKHLRALVAYTYGLNTDTADKNVLINIVYIMGKLDEARLTKRPVEKLIDDFLVNSKRLAVLQELLRQDFDHEYVSCHELLSLLKKYSKTTGENPTSYYKGYHRFDSPGLNFEKKEVVVRRPDYYQKFAPGNIGQYQWPINPSHQDVRETYDEKLTSPTPMDEQSILFGMHEHAKQSPATKVPFTTTYINQIREQPLLSSIYDTESTLAEDENWEHKKPKLSGLNIGQREEVVRRPDHYPKFVPGNIGQYQWQINPSHQDLEEPYVEKLTSPTLMDKHNVLFGMPRHAKQSPTTKVPLTSTYINQIREQPLLSSIYDTESTLAEDENWEHKKPKLSGLNIGQREEVVRRPDHYPKFVPGNIGQYQWQINPSHQDVGETYVEKLASPTPMDEHNVLFGMLKHAIQSPITQVPLTSTYINQIREQPLLSSIYGTESTLLEDENQEHKKLKLPGLIVEQNEGVVRRPDRYPKFMPGHIGQYQWQLNPTHQDMRENYDENRASAPMDMHSVLFGMNKNAEQSPTIKVSLTSTYMNQIREQPLLSSIYGTETTPAEDANQEHKKLKLPGLNVEQNEGVVRRPDRYPKFMPGHIGQYQWQLNPTHQDMREIYDENRASAPMDVHSVLFGMNKNAEQSPTIKVPLTSTYMNQITEQPLLSSIYGTESTLAVDAKREHKKLKLPKTILQHKTNQYITKEFSYPNYVYNNGILDTVYHSNNDLTTLSNLDTDSIQYNTGINFVPNLPFEGSPTAATQVDWNKNSKYVDSSHQVNFNNNNKFYADYTSKDNWPIQSDFIATLSPFGERSEYLYRQQNHGIESNDKSTLKPRETDSASSSDYEKLLNGLKTFENLRQYPFIYKNEDNKYTKNKHFDRYLNENQINLGSGPVENESHQNIIIKGVINKVDLENIVKQIHYKSIKHGLREENLHTLLEIQDNVTEAIITEYLWNQIQFLRSMNIDEQFINKYVYMIAMNRLPNIFRNMHTCALSVSSKLPAAAMIFRGRLYKKILPNVNIAYS